MNYISLNIAFSDAMQAEILTAELADYPFESFEADAGTLKAYIPQACESLWTLLPEIISAEKVREISGRNFIIRAM